MSAEEKKQITDTINDSGKFAKLEDEMERVDYMRAYLFFNGTEHNKKTGGKASDHDIYSEIMGNILLYRTSISPPARTLTRNSPRP